MLRNIKQLLHKRLFYGFFSMLLSLLFVFPTGFFSNETFFEREAENIAKLAKQNPSAEYVNLLVEPQDNLSMPMPSADFYNLYGIFNILENKCTFAGTGNADKAHSLTIQEISECENLSILFAESNSNIEYKGHWKHDYYPLELMFKGSFTKYNNAFSFCYIGESYAKKLLDLKGEDYTEDNFNALIGKDNIVFVCDGKEYVFTIANIYLETNYFYDGLQNVMGDFVVMSMSFPSEIRRQASFFLNQYKFQNKYYMNYICSRYSNDKYSLKLNKFNLTKFDNQNVTDFFVRKNDNQALSWFFLILAIVLLIVSSVIMYLDLLPRNKMQAISFFVIAFSPYLLFKVIYLITKQTAIFSSFSSVANLIFIILYLLLFIILFMTRTRTLKHSPSDGLALEKDYDEIII